MEVIKTTEEGVSERIKLTPTEFEILYCLMQHEGEPVRLATLLKDVWGYEADDDVRMLRVHMGGLRQKLEPNPKQPIELATWPGKAGHNGEAHNRFSAP